MNHRSVFLIRETQLPLSFREKFQLKNIIDII